MGSKISQRSLRQSNAVLIWGFQSIIYCYNVIQAGKHFRIEIDHISAQTVHIPFSLPQYVDITDQTVIIQGNKSIVSLHPLNAGASLLSSFGDFCSLGQVNPAWCFYVRM